MHPLAHRFQSGIITLVTVIVLDTNALPRGQFSLHALNSLINVAGPGATIVIPEVVVWEWAEHALSAHVALEEEIKKYRVDAAVLSRPEIKSSPPIEELVKRIEAALPAEVRTWSPLEAAWRSAVRDQVLQIGSGEAKGGVKTGAADAIVLACVEHESDFAENAVVLVSSDKRLRDNARQENVRVASGSGGLMGALQTFTPATDDLVVRLAEQLPEFFNESIEDIDGGLSFRDYGVAVEFDGDTFGRTKDDSLSSLFIPNVEFVEIDDLRVETTGDDRLGLAELRIFGNIVGEVLTYREISPGVLGATREVVDFSTAFVDVTIAARWDHNWRLRSVVPTGVALLVIVDPDVDSDERDYLQFRAEPAN